MAIQQRHKRLLRLLAERGSVSVVEMTRWLGVSATTVRRDLALLNKTGQIRRIREGGTHIEKRWTAALLGGSFTADLKRYFQHTQAIARHAAAMCKDGDTVLIGGGTTTHVMADFLGLRRMRVVTNSFEVARILLASSEIEVLISGGAIHAREHLMLGTLEPELIQYCYADKLFLGVDGLTPHGAMEADPLRVQAGRRLVGQAEEVIVLAESSKFANVGGALLCSLEQMTRVVTDDDVSDAAVQMIERAGVEVCIVSAGRSDRIDDGASTQRQLHPMRSSNITH